VRLHVLLLQYTHTTRREAVAPGFLRARGGMHPTPEDTNRAAGYKSTRLERTSTTGGTRLPHFRKALDHDCHDSDTSPRPRTKRSGPKRRDFHRHNSVISSSAHDQGHVLPDLPESAEAVSPPLQPANPQLPQVARSQTSTVLKKKPPRCGTRSNLGVGNVSRLSYPSTPTTVFIVSASRSLHLFLHTRIRLSAM